VPAPTLPGDKPPTPKKAKAVAKPKPATDYHTSANKQKAIRELASCEKIVQTAKVLKEHSESVNASQITTKELSFILTKLEERKHIDNRWVYTGEDLQGTDVAGKDARMELFDQVVRFNNWVGHPSAQISLSA
jgi:hypothetical protein